MNWLELTALDETKTLIHIDKVDYVSTGYERPGCMIHFHGGNTRSVSDDIETVKKAIQVVIEGRHG